MQTLNQAWHSHARQDENFDVDTKGRLYSQQK